MGVRIGCAVLLSACLAACGGSSDDDAAVMLVSASDADAVSKALVVTVGDVTANRTDGALPVQTNTGSEPTVSSSSASITAANDETVDVSISVSSASAVASLLQQVAGAGDYLSFDVSAVQAKATVTESTDFTVNVKVPENITDGVFCLDTVATDADSRVSAAFRICIDVESTIDDAPAGGASDDFSSLTPGTYVSQVQGDEEATQFIFEQGGSGTWSYGQDEGGAINWTVGSDGVLLISFDGGGTESYVLTAGTVESGSVRIEFSNEPSRSASWALATASGDDVGFLPLTPGTYDSQVEGDSSATRFVLNEGGSGTWAYEQEGGSIEWTVDGDGVLVLTYEGGGLESYTLTSGSTESGTVQIYFSNEPSATGSWQKVN